MAHSPLKRHFQAISALAVVVMLVDMYYSGKFGASIDWASMIGLSAISLGSGLLLVAVVFYHRCGFEMFAKGLACVWAVCFVFNIFSNMGVATANRVVEVDAANIKQAIHAERDKSKDEAKARLVVFEKQLKDLIIKDSWAATVTAEGLRQQVADLRSSRESEARLGGCGQKCRGIENQIIDIQGKIAVAEQRENLDKRIEATKNVLAEARSTLADTDAGVSHTAAQASLYSRWTVGWMGDGESTAAVRNANELMGIAMALVIAVASAGLTLAGVWEYLMTITKTNNPNTAARTSSPKATMPFRSVAPVTSQSRTDIVLMDSGIKERIQQVLSNRYGQVAA